MVKYKWHTRGSNTCYACKRWDGNVFESIDSVPDLPVHPNCECLIEATEESKPNPELEKIGDDLRRVKNAASTASKEVSGYQSISWLKERVLSAVRRLLIDLHQFTETVDVFWENYQDMKEANTIGADKYFHSKANAEAAQLGKTDKEVADFISRAREVVDFWKYLLRDKMEVEAIIEDMNKDLKANTYGRKVGRENPDAPVKDLIKIYRPEGLDEKY